MVGVGVGVGAEGRGDDLPRLDALVGQVFGGELERHVRRLRQLLWGHLRTGMGMQRRALGVGSAGVTALGSQHWAAAAAAGSPVAARPPSA